MKKILITLILLTVVCSGLFAGAPKQEKGEGGHFSIFIGEPLTPPTADNKIYKILKEKLGVTFELEFLVGNLNEKIGVLIAGGDYPDIISGGDAASPLIDAGVVIPLEDLIIEHAPKIYEHYKPFWNMIKNPSDGHIYFMPDYGRIYRKYTGTRSYGPAFFIQRGVLKEFGYPKIKSLDEYFDIIRRYKEKYPEIEGKPTIGFEVLSYSWRDFCLKNPPQHLIGHPNDGDVVVDPETHHAEIFADKDYAKRYYKKLNDMYHAGLIEKETFVRTYDQYLSVVASGRVLGLFDQYWNVQQADLALKTQDKYEHTYVPVVPTFDGIRDYYMDRPPININRGFGITTACKDPAKFLKLLNTLLDENWQKILSWGIEGEDYLVDDNGIFYRTPEMRDKGNDATWEAANKAKHFFAYIPKIEGLYSDGNAWAAGDQPGEFFASLKKEETEYLEAYGYKTYIDVFSPPPPNRVDYPAWSITLEDGSEAQLVWNKIDELMTKHLPMVITAEPDAFDAAWEKYVGELRAQNIKAYEDAINEVVQYRVKNWSPPSEY